MRIAVLSDIHGNSIALDAVLADANTVGAEGYWVLGDLVALGHDPVGVLQRLTALPNTRFIRGNTDRYVAIGDKPPPPYKEDAQINSDLLRKIAEAAGSFAWTQGAVSATGWLEWLAKLPLELQSTLPDGTPFLGVHASPGNDDGRGVSGDLPDAELAQLLAGYSEKLIFVAHTHIPLDRKIGVQHVVNTGSVSNPRYPDLRASYVLLDARSTGYKVENRRVDYNRELVIAAVQALHHPGANYIIRHMQGLIK